MINAQIVYSDEQYICILNKKSFFLGGKGGYPPLSEIKDIV